MSSPYRYGCGERFETTVPNGYDFKVISVVCGSTSPTGDPWQCDDCSESPDKQPQVSFRQDALEYGESYEEDW